MTMASEMYWDCVMELIEEEMGSKSALQTPAGSQYNLAGLHDQYEQRLWREPPRIQSTEPIDHSAAPPHTVCCAPLVIQPEVISQNPVGVIRGKRTPATQEDGRPYIKKPPNAFMLFMKEMRPTVKAQFEHKDSARVNKVLGQMWKSLTQAEKEKYFREAESLKEVHASTYPQWSCRDNYGKKTKKRWSNRATAASVSEPPRQTTTCVTMAQPASLQSVSDVHVTQEASGVNLAFSPSDGGLQMATTAEASLLAPPTPTLNRDSSTQLLSLVSEIVMMWSTWMPCPPLHGPPCP